MGKLFGIRLGPPPVDQKKIVQQLTSQGVPADVATQQAAQMGSDIGGLQQAGNKGLVAGAGAIAGGALLGAGGVGPFAHGAGAAASGASGASGIPGIGGDGSTVDPSTGQPYGNGGSFYDWALSQLKKGAGALTGGGGSDILDKLLLGGSVAAGAADEAYKKGLVKKAIDSSTSAYNDNAPLRSQGRTLLQNRSTPDLSSIFDNPGDPYARRAPTTSSATY